MTVQAVVRALSVLEALAEAPDGLRLHDLSRRVGLHKATAFRLVRTLVALGYVRQAAERDCYVLEAAWPPPAAARPRSSDSNSADRSLSRTGLAR